MYGGSSDAPQICPGEANCEKWAGTSGATHADKEQIACHPCPMFQTKKPSGQINHRYLTHLAERALYIRTRMNAGYPLPTSEMPTPQFDATIMAQHAIDTQELMLKCRTAELLERFIGGAI